VSLAERSVALQHLEAIDLDGQLCDSLTAPAFESATEPVNLGIRSTVPDLSCHVDDGGRCYCYECVEERNTVEPEPISSFRDEMLRAGFTDQDSSAAELRDHIGADFYDDILFLLKRIHSLDASKSEHAPVVQPSETFFFNQAIEKLRRENRTRPATDRGSKLAHITTYGTRGSCYSVRQRTEKPPDRQRPEPFETRAEQFDGPVVPIWHQPDHLVFKSHAAYTKPRYTGEHVVMLGDLAVRPDEIYSQGQTRAVLNGKEVIVTDFWAANYQKTWRAFVGVQVAKIHSSRGDRERDEFFEPTEQQMESWREKYAKDSEFKKKDHARFQQTEHKWLFKNQTDEAPEISQRYHPKELEREAEQQHVATKPKKGKPWCDDRNFVDDLNGMLPKGYSKLLVYQSGHSAPFPGDLRLAPARDGVLRVKNWSTYLVAAPRPWTCPTYRVPISDVKLMKSSSVGEEAYSDQGLSEREMNRKIFLGVLEPSTAAELQYAENLLRGNADRDLRLHEQLRHFYEYGYRYYRADWPMGDTVFESVKNTTSNKADQIEIIPTWDDAIRNTFGHLVEDTPPDGFYVMYKMSDLAATRVYPILLNRQTDFVLDEHEEPVYLIRDSSAEVVDFDLEAPAPLGIRDIHGQIRTVVGGMRTKSKTAATISADLRNIVRVGEIKHIRFTWDDIRGLTWVVC